MKNKNIQKFEDDRVHRWYTFVLSFPDHFVSNIITKSGIKEESIILDPFVGTGTTIIEAKKRGYNSIGIEANPICYFASKTKSNWDLDINLIQTLLKNVKSEYIKRLKRFDLSFPGQITNFMRSDSNKNDLQKPFNVDHELLNDKYISPIPWTKITVLKESIHQIIEKPKYFDLFYLTLAKTFRSIANVKFGPEIGYIKPKLDANVIGTFINYVNDIIEDLKHIYKNSLNLNPVPLVKLGDSRKIDEVLIEYENCIDLVITSPPYPVDKDYTRITRLEIAILDMAQNILDIRKIKKTMLRSSTRQVYKEDNEKEKVKDISEIFEISNEIRSRVKQDGDTSGFSKVYPRLVEEYFGGMYNHFQNLKILLKPKAKCYYLIGDSRSFKMVHIEAAKLCGIIAKKLGYKVKSIEVFRNRNSTAHNHELFENILILEN